MERLLEKEGALAVLDRRRAWRTSGPSQRLSTSVSRQTLAPRLVLGKSALPRRDVEGSGVRGHGAGESLAPGDERDVRDVERQRDRPEYEHEQRRRRREELGEEDD